MRRTLAVVTAASRIFRERLVRTSNAGGLSIDQYVRYLSMQYHLTNGVQRHFLSVAGHPSLRRRRALREFLVNFAWEEEMHYEIARRDLAKLDREILPCPLDVKLWWSFFDAAVLDRPFVRLGGTCVLENLGAGGGDVVKSLLAAAPYLNKDNTHFIQIHLHEVLPHGKQIVGALEQAQLDPLELDDLAAGARDGATIYLRLQAWALGMDEAASQVEAAAQA